MGYFSLRNGFCVQNSGVNETSSELRERLWSVFYKQEFDINDPLIYNEYTTGIEDMMIEMGIQYEFPYTRMAKNKNAEKLHRYVVQCGGIWYRIYDFIEKYLKIRDKECADKMSKEFNRILEEEVAAYRILDGQVVPIVNEGELHEIARTIDSNYESVSKHMKKALELYSDRRNPDYENSVKESICAVEAMCCIITETDGGSATLGSALKKLRDYGVVIHSALESAFLKLYGYTSDSGGIRHGNIEFIDVPCEDAKYMLISCSSFVNYLISKWVQVKGEKSDRLYSYINDTK